MRASRSRGGRVCKNKGRLFSRFEHRFRGRRITAPALRKRRAYYSEKATWAKHCSIMSIRAASPHQKKRLSKKRGGLSFLLRGGGAITFSKGKRSNKLKKFQVLSEGPGPFAAGQRKQKGCAGGTKAFRKKKGGYQGPGKKNQTTIACTVRAGSSQAKKGRKGTYMAEWGGGGQAGILGRE